MVAGSSKGISDTPPAVAVGSSSMTITGTLALFAALWASVLKRKEFRLKQVRYKIKTSKIEELQEHQRNLLFFLLVGAERGKIEVRPPSVRRCGVGSLARLAGAGAVAGEDPAPVAAVA